MNFCRVQRPPTEKKDSFKRFVEQILYFIDQYSIFISKANSKEGIYDAKDENYMAACMALLSASTTARDYRENQNYLLKTKNKQMDWTLLQGLIGIRDRIAHSVEFISKPQAPIEKRHILEYKEALIKNLENNFSIKKTDIDMKKYSEKDEDGYSPRAIMRKK